MPADTIKVLPNCESAVGMKHPAAELMTADGADWPYDSFTCRRLADESIRRAEVEAAPVPAPTGKANRGKATDAPPPADTPAA